METRLHSFDGIVCPGVGSMVSTFVPTEVLESVAASSEDTRTVVGRALRKRATPHGCGTGCMRLAWCQTLVALGLLGWFWPWWIDQLRLPHGYCKEKAAPFPLAPEPHDMDGLTRWASGMVNQMTLDEKHRLVNGVGYMKFAFQQLPGYYVGNAYAIPRLGLPSINLHDAMQGFRTMDASTIGQVTSWPCALAIAATWNSSATWDWAKAIADEFAAKGANVVLGPSVNVHRVPRNGRNAEYISGEDPYLGKDLAAAYVRGVQEGAGLVSVVKHFVLNQQETNRQQVDSTVDERTLWEQYYPPFQSAVDAGVASVMCAYNWVNGQQACESHSTLTEDLKGRMDFRGFVMSDWWAFHSDMGAMAGTDMNMPGNDGHYSMEKIEKLPRWRLNEMAARVLHGMARAPAYRSPSPGSCRVGCNCRERIVDAVATNQAHLALARRLAAEGAVLLRNEAPYMSLGNVGDRPRRLLPLQPDQIIAVVGKACFAGPMHLHWYTDWTASDYYVVGGSGRVLSNRTTSIVSGLEAAGLTVHVSNSDALVDAERAMGGADVVVTCGGATAAEASDRKSLDLDQKSVIPQMLSAASSRGLPAAVVVLAPGAVLLPWHTDATAVLLMFLSGEATGHAAADILLGKVSPSGRLPITLPASEDQTLKPCQGSEPCMYTEGLRGGWHVYDGHAVAYPFGHGLGYAEFEFLVARNWSRQLDPARRWEASILVRNTGDFGGAETVQLYVQFPDGDPARPDYQLRGFRKTPTLWPGQSHLVTFSLSDRDLSRWDVLTHSWKLVHGGYATAFGASSRDLRIDMPFYDGGGDSALFE